MAPETRPRVVIVGAGFGGLSAARALAGAAVQVTVVDRRNFHLFQPLLYQVATAGLNPADIAWPIRSLLRDQANAEVVLGEVSGIERTAREVLLSDGRRLPYDYLVLATGATHNYFGHPEWEAVAPGLKRVDDATLIRRRVLLAFERAEASGDAETRRRQLSFVIIGGGPTGVEMAGAIAELARKALCRDFRHINPGDARIVLVEGGPRLLGSFPPALSDYAHRALTRMGVEVQLDRRVLACHEAGVETDAGPLPAATLIWAAGISASPAARWLVVAADRAGRVQVEDDLSVPGLPGVYAVGDTAALSIGGQPVPGIAPAAKQAGEHAARQILRSLAGAPSQPFRYRHHGNLATIGRHAAVIDFGRLRLRGGLAWLLWGLVHIYFLIGARNRLLVGGQWLFSYLTFGRGARLIAGSDPR
ncbi:MAG TPA: NAD(P)/FAD-dependent oxidoreductase [Nevskiaceae bacterium]|nr:NAD(P)/FAD-dependent oxidoreductase [Nevskiaceae bacterium]